MICLILTPNAFEPLKRTVDYAEWRFDLRLRDLLPEGYTEDTTLAYLNGERCEDWDKRVYDCLLYTSDAADE